MYVGILSNYYMAISPLLLLCGYPTLLLLCGGCLFHTLFLFVRGLPLSLLHTPFLFVRGLSVSLSLPLTLFLFVRGLPLLLFEYMGHLLCSYHSFLLSLFLFVRAFNSAVTTAIKPTLEHMLEINSLT
jgi:hypothetical protein